MAKKRLVGDITFNKGKEKSGAIHFLKETKQVV